MFKPGKNIQNGKRGLLRIIFSRTMLITALLILNFLFLYYLLFDFIHFLPVLLGSVTAFTTILELIILNSHDDPDVKLTWAVVVALLPVFGAFLYLFIRFDLGNRVNRKLINTSIQSSLPYAQAEPELLERLGTDAPDFAPIARYLSEYAHAPAFSDTEATYFPLGDDMFPALLEELEKAREFIFMEYFLVSEGHMWNSILDILRRKAAEGVEIRFLYDGMNAFANLPYGYPEKLQKMGIQCKMHAPVRPFVSSHYNNRDHRKITVIDGHTAFTGGINLEDRYINIDSPYGHWKDTAVMLKGNAVRGFTVLFLQMWNATEREHNYLPYLKKPAVSPMSTGFVIPYGDNPVDCEHVGESVYLDMINRSANYLYIMTPYLIPDSEMISALKFAAKRGVDVRLFLPGICDMKLVQIIARSYYRELIRSGVRIYEYTPGFIHAKVFLSDDIRAVVSTVNLDYRSLRHHFECGAYLYRLPVLADIRQDFFNTQKMCKQISPEDIRKFSRLSRVFAYLIKFAAPLL